MDDMNTAKRPASIRSITEPSPSTLLHNHFVCTPKKQPTSTRTRSPLSRSHMRSHSSGSALAAPVVARAQSMPAVHSAMRTFDYDGPTSLHPTLNDSHSPQPSPARVRSPLVPEAQDIAHLPPRSPRWFESSSGAPIESIQEDSELDLTPRNSSISPLTAPPPTMRSASAPLRRRPASPLYSLSSPAMTPSSATVLDGSGSPMLGPARFNETLPSSFSLHHYASNSSFSSVSSTPSSARSRSPSISSLDTIEDEPDAEYEALEADRLWRLSLSDKADRGEESDDTYRRRGFGFGRGRNTERKRWSVCGGERRADLDLETIWED